MRPLGHIPCPFSPNDFSTVCGPFSARPPLNEAQGACVARLLRHTHRSHLTSGLTTIRTEEEYEDACSLRAVDPQWLSCTEARLRTRAEPYEAVNRCEPHTARCESFLRGGRAQSPKREKSLKGFCLEFGTYFKANEKCAAPGIAEVRAKCASFLENKKPFLECIRDVHPTRWRFLWDIRMLAHLCDKIPPTASA